MSNRVPVPIKQIIWRLEGESANTDTDPRWRAACALREMQGWESRTLMCEIDESPSETFASSAGAQHE